MTPWTDVEIVRFTKRVGLFTRRGLDADQAEQIADRLAQRDQDRDDRRMCIECKHLQRDGGCFLARQGRLYASSGALEPVGLRPIQLLLLRCHGFEWRIP